MFVYLCIILGTLKQKKLTPGMQKNTINFINKWLYLNLYFENGMYKDYFVL